MKLARWRRGRGDEGSTQIVMLMACVCTVALTVMLVPLAHANDMRTRAQSGADAAAIGAVKPLRDEVIRVAMLGMLPNDVGLWAIAPNIKVDQDKLPYHRSAEDYARRNDTVVTEKVRPSGARGYTMKVSVRSADCRLKDEDELTAKDRKDLAERRNLCTDSEGKEGIAKSYGTASAIAQLQLPPCRGVTFPTPGDDGDGDGMILFHELYCDDIKIWTSGGYRAPRRVLLRLFKIRLVAKEDEEYKGRPVIPGGEGFSAMLPDASTCPEGGPMGPENITPRMRCVRDLIKQKFTVPKGIGCYRANGGITGGGEHPLGRACDFMISGPNGPSQSEAELGFAIANWAYANARELGIYYVIYRQHIYNPQRHAEGWRPMEDRGSITQNHFDHVHISVL
ncbi:Tad domain-containing protein [Actinomadura sp. B10D3]|uniref:Tad domain-containing protein n=1 Tax=Actinomadura sp. B10D3 TaxID=3153557 RepID=UPI00325E17CC